MIWKSRKHMMQKRMQEEARLVRGIVLRKSELTIFPQGRVTDHRIGLTLYKLDKIMDGDIQEIIDACVAADQAKKLSNMENED